MIITFIFVIAATLITIFLCKKIAGTFDKKNELLVEQEKLLYSEQEGLRTQRKNSKRKLAELKKNALTTEHEINSPKQKPIAQNLKEWLQQKQHIESSQYSVASQFADEKNMNLLSALLTLNIINVQTYEEAKKLKFKS